MTSNRSYGATIRQERQPPLGRSNGFKGLTNSPGDAMRRSIVTLIAIVVLGACGDRARTANRPEQVQALVAPAPTAARDMSEGAAPEAAYGTQPDVRPAPQQRMIARTAQIRAVVSDPVATVQALTTLVEAKGGFISDSRQWRSGEQMLASLTIRVPVRDLPATLDSIRHRAIRVENESTSGEDVTVVGFGLAVVIGRRGVEIGYAQVEGGFGERHRVVVGGGRQLHPNDTPQGQGADLHAGFAQSALRKRQGGFVDGGGPTIRSQGPRRPGKSGGSRERFQKFATT